MHASVAMPAARSGMDSVERASIGRILPYQISSHLPLLPLPPLPPSLFSLPPPPPSVSQHLVDSKISLDRRLCGGTDTFRPMNERGIREREAKG